MEGSYPSRVEGLTHQDVQEIAEIVTTEDEEVTDDIRPSSEQDQERSNKILSTRRESRGSVLQLQCSLGCQEERDALRSQE